ncbi:MAG: hypothetical protein JKY49_00405 [Cohaesibacteraceae bacterium]|nr:hypothetical protein [Cohaesibacteraceae bacterium]MBL4875759.1 hypothetical protein [Cohaesibacteraceae bacterium]
MIKYTLEDLKTLIDALNRFTGSPEEGFRNGSSSSNVGHYFNHFDLVSGCRLARYIAKNGDVIYPLGPEPVPECEAFPLVEAYLVGLSDGGGLKETYIYGGDLS